MELFKSSGLLHYRLTKDGGYSLRVEVEQSIADFYRALIPKWHRTNRQMYPAHISVVRKEVPVNLEFWGKYEDEEVEFVYGNEIYHGTVYWWINCFSKRLEEVRIELGLPVSSQYTRPPDSFVKCFHCTIGNNKDV